MKEEMRARASRTAANVGPWGIKLGFRFAVLDKHRIKLVGALARTFLQSVLKRAIQLPATRVGRLRDAAARRSAFISGAVRERARDENLGYLGFQMLLPISL